MSSSALEAIDSRIAVPSVPPVTAMSARDGRSAEARAHATAHDDGEALEHAAARYQQELLHELGEAAFGWIFFHPCVTTCA